MSVEQLIMQIATRDAQVIPPIPLMYGEFMTEERGLLLTDASGAHLFQLRKFLRTLRCYEVPFGSGIQEIEDGRGIFHAHFIQRAHTGEESSSARRATCCKFIQCIGGVEHCHAVPAVMFISTKVALGESLNFAFSHFITLQYKVKTA